MPRRIGENGERIIIRRPKKRVKIPLNTDTVIHRPDKAYSRKGKHKRRFDEIGEDEEELGQELDQEEEQEQE